VSHRSDSNLGSLAKTVVRGNGEAMRGKAVLTPTGIQLMLVQVGLGAMFWFLAVAWLQFAWGRHVDFDLAVASGFFVMLFTLFLLVAALAVSDSRASNAGTENERPFLGAGRTLLSRVQFWQDPRRQWKSAR
jgi:hypothetical protein